MGGYLKDITKCAWDGCTRERHFDAQRDRVRRWCSVHCGTYEAQANALPESGKVVQIAPAT